MSMYCEMFKARLKHCGTFDKKRIILHDYISQTSFEESKMELHGEIPIHAKTISFILAENR